MNARVIQPGSAAHSACAPLGLDSGPMIPGWHIARPQVADFAFLVIVNDWEQRGNERVGEFGWVMVFSGGVAGYLAGERC